MYITIFGHIRRYSLVYTTAWINKRRDNEYFASPSPPTKLDLLNEACHLVPSTLRFYIISSLSAVFRKRLLMKMRQKKKETILICLLFFLADNRYTNDSSKTNRRVTFTFTLHCKVAPNIHSNTTQMQICFLFFLYFGFKKY